MPVYYSPTTQVFFDSPSNYGDGIETNLPASDLRWAVAHREEVEENGETVVNWFFYINQDAKAQALASSGKLGEVTQAYEQMNEDVYAKMKEVFGTSKSDSATAFFETWKDMKVSPNNYVGLGLKVREDIFVNGVQLFDEGALLDTAQKVVDYATAKVNQALAYGVWRMQRIQQFETERSQILGS